MKRLAIAGILVATVATAVLSASAGAASDWNYVAKPPYVQGPRLSAGASSLPDQLAPPTCDFGGGNVFRCYTPGLLRRAYDFPSTATLNGAGQTILIFDAYGDAEIQQDLALFDGIFGISAPPSFTVLCPMGCPKTQTAGPHAVDSWDLETALDVEYAHAMAPGANVVLAVAPSSSGNAINNAERKVLPQYPGAIVSQSFGIPEALIHNNKTQLD